MDRDRVEPQVDEIPGDRARAAVEAHHEHAAPSTTVYGFVWDVDAPATGPFCTDVDGNVLMDWASHVGSAPLGYRNPDLLEKLEPFDRIEPAKIAGQDFYVEHGETDLPAPADLMERLVDHSAHYDMDTVFLSNTGAEAVENAMKVAFDHRGGGEVFTFEGAFHGRTLGALSLNRSKAVHRRDMPAIPRVHTLPYCDDRRCDRTTCDCGFFRGDGSILEDALHPKRGHVDPDDVAAIVVEPIQGEGGYRFPSDTFADELARVADAYDVPIVADEVQAGVGRTGEFWASDHYAFDPDVIASAKALRVGATIGSEAVFPDEKGRLSSTWGAGDLLAVAMGAFTIDVIEEQDLMANAAEKGLDFRERFADLTRDSDAVIDVRGEGLMLAVEYDSKQRREDVLDAAVQHGLLTLGCGHRTMRLLPPLDSTQREMELGAQLLADAVEAVE